MGRTGERPEGPAQRRRGHGEGSIYQRKDGMWVGVATIGRTPEGKQKRKYLYGRKYEDVRRELKKVLNELDAGNLVTTTRASKLSEYLAVWLPGAQKRLAPESYRSYEGHVRVHINPHLGGLRLDALTGPIIQRWVHTLPPASARNIHRTLSIALNSAVKMKLIPANPAKGVDIPKSGNAKERHKPIPLRRAGFGVSMMMDPRGSTLLDVLGDDLDERAHTLDAFLNRCSDEELTELAVAFQEAVARRAARGARNGR